VCIVGTVGKGGNNTRSDVRTILIPLERAVTELDLQAPLDEDGAMGAATLAVIEKFQRLMATANPTVCIEPYSATLMRLWALPGEGFNFSKLKGTLIEASESNVDRYFTALSAVAPTIVSQKPQAI